MLIAPDFDGARFISGDGLAQMSSEGQKPKDARKHIEAALTDTTQPGDKLPWVYVELARIAKETNDENTLVMAVNAAIATSEIIGQAEAADAARALLK